MPVRFFICSINVESTNSTTQISDLLAQITGEPSPTLPVTVNTQKRKADGDFRRPLDKVQRTGPPPASSAQPINGPPRPAPMHSSMSKMKFGPNDQRLPTPTTAGSTFKNGQPTPPPFNDGPKAAPKPPKKGSYAEIMARGKAAQATLGQIGKIQHKRIEKPPSKRERAQMKAQKTQKVQKAFAPNSKFQTGDQPHLKDGRNGSRENNGKVSSGPALEKKVKKAGLATTGYTGTARPLTGGAKGPSRPSASASSSRHDRDMYGFERRGSSRQYGYASEEAEEEEEEENGDDYDSDASSDMEAAAFEVDEEEEMASRIARREDAEALAEENRLKREKEEKKRKLAAMAAKAKSRRF